ncbi:putative IS1 encoded protein [Shigella flexneri K-315]|uniref:Putative IS1 encoded protein n=1 Tax=Shigella flexneri K-315 TaxID=766150 RepID=I6C7E2_SHIFL|nr:putative IS1 encoded protein [Shigella flexneri K-315]
MPCFTAMRAEIALMSGSAFAVTHHAFSSGAGRTSDGNGSHASTLKSPSYTKSVSWQHYRLIKRDMGELLKILKKHIDEAMNTQVLSSNFCKLVCIYDYIKNSHRY